MALIGDIPVWRLFDKTKARDFYCGCLGLPVAFEHRFHGGAALYMQVEKQTEGRLDLNFDRLTEGSEGTIDGVGYRQLMRHQAAGVAVVASGLAGGRVGLTATSVASLSDAPPKLLVCVGRATRAHNVLSECGVFSVNFLAREDEALAEVFAGRKGLDGEERFAHGRWGTLTTGAPVLETALSCLDCRLMESHTFTTHSIFIGRVIDGRADEARDPLVYFRGSYQGLAGA